MSFIAGSSQPITRTVLGSDGATVNLADKTIRLVLALNHLLPRITLSQLQPQEVMCVSGDKHQINRTHIFMMYPYQQDAKISANNNTQAIYEYNFPKDQNAIAGTFDPKANVSVGIIHSVENHSLHTMLVVCSALPSRNFQT